MAAVVAGSMVGGTRFHPDVIQSECSRVWSSTWLAHSPCLRHATGIVYLDNAFVLIEGHPTVFKFQTEKKKRPGHPSILRAMRRGVEFRRRGEHGRSWLQAPRRSGTHKQVRTAADFLALMAAVRFEGPSLEPPRRKTRIL